MFAPMFDMWQLFRFYSAVSLFVTTYGGFCHTVHNFIVLYYNLLGNIPAVNSIMFTPRASDHHLVNKMIKTDCIACFLCPTVQQSKDTFYK